MKRPRIILVSGIALLVMGWFLFGGRGENLHDCRITIALDKDEYRVGDPITMTVRIIPTNRKSLTLFSDLSKSVFISGLRPVVLPRRTGATSRHKFSPEEPLEFRISGTVKRHDESTAIDFGAYGVANLDDFPSHFLKVQVYPAKIGMYDSVDWSGSNQVKLNITDSEHDVSADR
jgi:hypothetical protein